MEIYTQVDKMNMSGLKHPYFTHTCSVRQATTEIDPMAACKTLTLYLEEIGTANDISFRLNGGRHIADFYKALKVDDLEQLTQRKVQVVQRAGSYHIEGLMPYTPLHSEPANKQTRVA